jgi:hypothetical protein
MTIPPNRGSAPALFAPIEDPAPRLVKVIWSTGTTILSHGERQTLDMAGGGLSKLNGQALLLVQHSRYADDVIGVVEEGWVEGPIGVSIVRFAGMTALNISLACYSTRSRSQHHSDIA